MHSWVVFGIILVHFVSSFDVSPNLFLQVNLSKISSFTVRCNYSRPTKLENRAFLTCWIYSQDCPLNTGRPRCMSCFCAFKLISEETCVIVIFVLLLKLLWEEILGLPCSSFKWRRVDGRLILQREMLFYIGLPELGLSGEGSFLRLCCWIR